MSGEFGPVTGLKVPDFTLPDERKQPRPLRDTLGEKGLLLAFIHGTWCVPCVQGLHRLRQHAPTYERMGIRVATVSYDSPGETRAFKESTVPPMTFPILSDETGAIHDLYNLEQVRAYLLINHDGVLTHKFIDTENQGWPGSKWVLAAIETYLDHTA